jgi:hypothetical protein
LAEVTIIPPGACLGLDDHYALSTNALRQLLVNMQETETQHALDLAWCKGAARVADKRAEIAEHQIEEHAFWSRWGPMIGAAIGLVVGASVPTAVLILRR